MHENDDFSHPQVHSRFEIKEKGNFPFMSWKNYEKRFILLLNAFNALQYRKSALFSKQ
jgi:hypothetical protein